MSEARCRMPDAGSPMPEARCRKPDAGSPMQITFIPRFRSVRLIL
jgi:hypothetical protein